MMHRGEYLKPDGRKLWLYGRRPVSALAPAGSPAATRIAVATHLRRDPLRQEWVIFAAHRQERTFMPPAERDPLAPSADPLSPTELPPGDYEVAVFENLFPSLVPEPPQPPEVAGVELAPALGACEVVVFAQQAKASLGELPHERIALIIEVWADRTQALQQAGLAYVLPFENRGTEMGVTLLHPHGQIYAYGFLPQQQKRVAQALLQHYLQSGQDLVSSLAAEERRQETRLVAARGAMVAFAPAFGRFPYETWIAPCRHVPDLAGLTAEERLDAAYVLSDVLRRLDALWQRPMPYLLTVNQAPNDGGAHPEWTLRIEVCPIRRAVDKLKYLAGTELGAGVFANDVTPERAAAELRRLRL